MTDDHIRSVLNSIHDALVAPDYESNKIAHAQRIVRDALADLGPSQQDQEWGPDSVLYAQRMGSFVIDTARHMGWNWTESGTDPFNYVLSQAIKRRGEDDC